MGGRQDSNPRLPPHAPRAGKKPAGLTEAFVFRESERTPSRQGTFPGCGQHCWPRPQRAPSWPGLGKAMGSGAAGGPCRGQPSSLGQGLSLGQAPEKVAGSPSAPSHTRSTRANPVGGTTGSLLPATPTPSCCSSSGSVQPPPSHPGHGHCSRPGPPSPPSRPLCRHWGSVGKAAERVGQEAQGRREGE